MNLSSRARSPFGNIVTGAFTPVLAKHTKHLSLVDVLAVGVDRMQRNFEPMRKQVEAWKGTRITDETAKLVIYRGFVEGELDVPKHLARTVHDLYFNPEVEEFAPRTMWSLSNAFTSAFKELEEINAAEIIREPLWNNLKHEHGPFDIIGDVHGCFDELLDLLKQLGYSVEAQADGDASSEYLVRPPEGRKVIFLGDLVDRGPKIPQVLRLVMSMVDAGTAICVPGNHDVKLMRKLRGKTCKSRTGLLIR